MSPQNESLEQVRRMAGPELSLRARLGYVALLLASLAMTVIVASLWLTEPALPARTRIAFGAMTLVGLSWMALATWVLRARRPLFARDRVIAGRMAVTFTSVFVAGAVAAVATLGTAASYGMLVTGVLMLIAAMMLLARARRRVAALLALAAELERAAVNPSA